MWQSKLHHQGCLFHISVRQDVSDTKTHEIVSSNRILLEKRGNIYEIVNDETGQRFDVAIPKDDKSNICCLKTGFTIYKAKAGTYKGALSEFLDSAYPNMYFQKINDGKTFAKEIAEFEFLQSEWG